MLIAVVDGQGGGIGHHIIQRIRESLSPDVEVLALGTNAVATSRMLKAGANNGASGENAIRLNSQRADVIVGTVSIVIAHSMMGELTPGMAEAISQSPALKILIPLTKSPLEIVGLASEPLPHYTDMLIERLEGLLGGEDEGV